MTLAEGETVLPPVPLDGPDDDLFDPSGFLACAATNGKLLCFPLAEVKALDRGRGVMLMQLDRGEKLAWTGIYRDELTLAGDRPRQGAADDAEGRGARQARPAPRPQGNPAAEEGDPGALGRLLRRGPARVRAAGRCVGRGIGAIMSHGAAGRGPRAAGLPPPAPTPSRVPS